MKNASKTRLAAELVAIFFLLPAALTALRVTVWPRLPVIPALWAVALPAAIWLGRNGATAASLFGLGKGVRELPRLLARASLLALPLAALLYSAYPKALFALPRQNPLLWLLVMVCYPLFSVLPQGIIYRAFFYRRYGGLFPEVFTRRVVAALCFSFSHVFFLNAWALALTFVGGLFFSRTYERTGSVCLSSVEHAVYGDLLFTLGYGIFLYHGTLQLMGA